MQLQLRLFGMPVIQVEDQPVRFENRKALALLAYVTAAPQAHTREKIAALLWPETENALAALRTTLWELRKKTGDDYLDISRQGIALNPHNGFWSDVGEYTALLQSAQEAAKQPQQRIRLLQQAVDLYQDDFLAGFSLRDSLEFDDWQVTQAGWFQRVQQHHLLELIALYESAADLHAAIQTAERLRLLDRLAEDPVEILLRLYLAAGQRQSVRRLYEEYAALLEQELGIRPGEACAALYRSTLEARAKPAPRPVTGPLAAGSITATVYHAADMVTGRPRCFLGRDQLIAQILALLHTGERVMLTGMGGIGKTSTAAYVAAEFIRSAGQPVIWLETGFQQSLEIVQALARAFDQQQAALIQPDPIAFVMQLVAQKCGLLVLDNCWNSAALFDIMQALPFSLPVLLTSRQRIPIDGEVIAVNVLDDEQARHLLAYHARRDLPDDGEVTALLRLLGRHPYALEIAGKQLKAQPGLSIHDLRVRYRKGVREIAVPGGYSGEGRQSIEHIIAASVDTVSPQARELLTCLGAFAVPRVSLELLAFTLQTDSETLQPAVGDLEQSSLIEIRHPEGLPFPVLVVHDLTYSYCRDLFRQSGQDRSLLVRGTGEYIRQYSRDVLLIEAELTNILGAVRAADHLGDGDSLIEIMRALMVDGYFDARGYTPELLEHLDRGIVLAKDLGESQREALHYLHSKRANVYQMQGRLEDALQENLEALGTAPDAHRRALIASTLGTIAFRLKREEYQLYLDEAEAVARTHQFSEILSRLMENRGYIAFSSGDPVQARLYFEQALSAAEQTGKADRIFYTLYNLSVLEIELQQYGAAEGYLKRAYLTASDSHNDLWLAMYFSSMGRCTHARGERPKTRQLMDQALAIYERLGDAESAEWVREFLATEAYD